MTGASWRDRIKVHPAADMFPMMSDEELDALAKDIAENELQHGVVLWTPEKILEVGRKGPKEIFLLDGRNRLEAIERRFKDDPEERAEAIENALYINGRRCATLLYADYTDPFAYVVSANIHRRHLNAEQKRDLIAALLKAKPERSDRETAKIAKVDHKTVAAVRTKAEAGGEIPHHDTRTGADGVKQPSRKPPKAPSEEAQAPPAPAAAPTRSCSFCEKPSAAVKVLIAGPEHYGVCLVYICDECVDLCVKLIAERRAAAGPDPIPDNPPPNATAQNPTEAAPEPEIERRSP
jgi:hypothetical protein